MQRQNWLLLLIIGLVVASIFVLIKLPLQLGLDLRGGSQLTIQVKPTETVTTIQPNDLKAVQNVIENRVNALGVSESLVQTVDSKNQVIVQLPGVTDPKEAERNLNVQAQLEFRQQKQGTEGEFRAEYSIFQQKKAELAALKAENKPENAAKTISPEI